MPVKMQPTSVIKARLGIEPNGKLEKFLVNTCARRMDKYVPYDEGNLADYRIDGNKIIYEQDYAKYQYYGMRKDGSHVIKNRNRSKHPLATTYWDRHMVTAEMPDIIQEAQNYMGYRRTR